MTARGKEVQGVEVARQRGGNGDICISVNNKNKGKEKNKENVNMCIFIKMFQNSEKKLL